MRLAACVLLLLLLLCTADCFAICCPIGTTGAQGGIKGILHNLTRGLAGHWPVSFLVREVLETEDNYPDAVKALQQSELMAPVYLTIAGVSPGEGCVLTRDRKAVVDGSGVNDDGGINGGGMALLWSFKQTWTSLCATRIIRTTTGKTSVPVVSGEGLPKPRCMGWVRVVGA